MNEKWLFVVIFMVVLAIGVYAMQSIYQECRAYGHSRMYCLAMISR